MLGAQKLMLAKKNDVIMGFNTTMEYVIRAISGTIREKGGALSEKQL
jgi:hypothetical protein